MGSYEVRLDWMDHDDGDLLAGPYPTYMQAAREAVRIRIRRAEAGASTFPIVYVKEVSR